MELEQENKENKKETQRCRQLAQRILRELAPGSVQVAGGRGVLEQELEHSGAVLTDAAPALLVMEDPAWEPLPETLGQQVLLVCGEETAFASCAAGTEGLRPGL